MAPYVENSWQIETRDARTTRMSELPQGVAWSQTDEDIEVSVSLPEECNRSSVFVKTEAEALTVAVRDSKGTWTRLLHGALREPVDIQSCCWAIERPRRNAGRPMLVVQLEKKSIGEWKALLKAATEGSILEELGRDQVIEDADGDNSSVTCGRCGALVSRARMIAHETMWCAALEDEDAEEDEQQKDGQLV